MREFFQRYKLLFLGFLPILLISGIIAGPAAILVTAAGFVYFVYLGRHDIIFLIFLLILILGDTRENQLQFFKPLRVEMLVLLTAYSIWEIRQGLYRISMYFIYFIPFLFVAALALLFSPLLNLGVTKTISFAMLYFVGLHYIFHKFKTYGIRLLGDVVFLSHIVLFVGLILLPIASSIVSYGGIRYNGLMGNPNGMGIFITLVAPLTIYYFRKEPTISSRYRTLTWFAIVLSLALCSSRNAIIAFSIFMLLHAGLGGTSFRTLIFIFVILPAAVLLVYNIDLEGLVYSMGLEKYLRIKDFQSGSGRIFAWQHAWELIELNPLIGCGFACEEYNFIYRTSFQLWATGHQGGVHNSYLAFMVNTGYIGFGLFVGFLFSMFRKVRNMRFLIPYLASILFSAMFESWMFSSLNAFHIYFVLTIVWGMVESTQRQLLASRLDNDPTEKTPNISFAG